MNCQKCKFFKKYIESDFKYVVCTFWPGAEDHRVIDPEENALICPVESRSHLICLK